MTADSDIWTKLHRSASNSTAAKPSSVDPPKIATPNPKRWVPISRYLDVLGTLLWSYLVIKVFIIDIDREMLANLGPSAVALLDYRVVAYLLLFAAAVWYWRSAWWRVLYVVFYPIVVLFWKVPYFLYRRRSWALCLAVVQTIASISSDLRYRATTLSLAVVAAIITLFTNFAPFIVAGVLYLGWLVAWTLIRFTLRTFHAPSFTTIQGKWIRRILATDNLGSAFLLADEYKQPDVENYDATQAQHVAMKVSIGIIVNKLLYLHRLASAAPGR